MSEEFQGGYNPVDGMYYAKGSFDNENEYNNEVICLVNHIDPTFQEIGIAIKEKRFNDVDQMIEAFKKQNQENVEALHKLGAYEGDFTLLDKAKDYLNDITDILNTVYSDTVNLIKSGTGSPQEISDSHGNMSKRYLDSTDKLSQALQEFLVKYGDSDEFDPEVGGYNPEDGQYYAKGSFDNEAEYYNEVFHLINYKDKYINAIAEALNNQQIQQVEALFKQFVEQNKTSIQKLKNLGAYEGDSHLLNSSVSYLNTLNNLVKSEYQEMLDIFRAEDRPMQEFQEKQEVLFEKIGMAENKLAEALELFIEKYDTDNLSEEIYRDEDIHQGMERQVYDENNPLLQPIHGISLLDYAAAGSKMANGMTEDQVAKALGVERPQWDEANQLWISRMQQDTEMKVAGLYGEYFALADQHPKFQNLSDDATVPADEENLARIKVDPEYFFDLTAGMQAAYNYGIDGAQWLRDNHGLSIGDFQGVAMQWAYSPVYAAMIPQLEERQKEYEKQFAAEMGGNIADDVEF